MDLHRGRLSMGGTAYPGFQSIDRCQRIFPKNLGLSHESGVTDDPDDVTDLRLGPGLRPLRGGLRPGGHQ